MQMDEGNKEGRTREREQGHGLKCGLWQRLAWPDLWVMVVGGLEHKSFLVGTQP